MPDSWQEYVYVVQSGLIAAGVAGIGVVLWWGVNKIITKIEGLEEGMKAFTLEMAHERESRKDHYHTLERRVDRLETRCEMRHSEEDE